MKLPKIVKKETLIKYIFNKLNCIIESRHIASIVNIFIDEMFIELTDDNKIDIKNFGLLFLKRTPKRIRFCVVHQDVRKSGAYRRLQLKIDKRIKKKLSDYLTVASASKDGYA